MRACAAWKWKMQRTRTLSRTHTDTHARNVKLIEYSMGLSVCVCSFLRFSTAIQRAKLNACHIFETVTYLIIDVLLAPLRRYVCRQVLGELHGWGGDGDGSAIACDGVLLANTHVRATASRGDCDNTVRRHRLSKSAGWKMY